jgi:hypothetical protein
VADTSSGSPAQRAPGTDGGRELARKILASVVTVAAGVGLMAFGTFGAFEDGHDQFPHSVISPTP